MLRGLLARPGLRVPICTVCCALHASPMAQGAVLDGVLVGLRLSIIYPEGFSATLCHEIFMATGRCGRARQCRIWYGG